ncbi:hypothetical protein [Kitasatospora sp. NPDC056531]|uniref:hypothetical protein n=1 Tax=Kitasatospora sp. NPDC056531 TaxID=3345856 RepID=UPI0036821869
MLTLAATATATLVAFAAPATAHTPVVLNSCNTLPQTSPQIPVGTDPIGWLGTLPQIGADRAAQLTMQAGQQLNVGFGVPDLAPENQLSTDQLPVVVIIAPDMQVTLLQPTMRTPLYNPDFNQNYLFLNNYSTTAIAGTYSLLMIGRSPERIFVATGVESEDFHGILRGSVATTQQLNNWYATPPTAPQAACTTP